MDIIKKLEGNKTLLVVTSSTTYNKFSASMTKKLAKKNVCYVTANKTFDSLKEKFTKSKVDLEKVVFIDAITKSIKQADGQTKGCYFVSSPGALTELSLVISKFLRHKFDYIVFDSVTNLSTYRKTGVVEKFICSLINKVKASKTKGVFLALNAKDQDDLIKKVSTFVDEVVEVK